VTDPIVHVSDADHERARRLLADDQLGTPLSAPEDVIDRVVDTYDRDRGR
jgi:hypothetical protein